MQLHVCPIVISGYKYNPGCQKGKELKTGNKEKLEDPNQSSNFSKQASLFVQAWEAPHDIWLYQTKTNGPRLVGAWVNYNITQAAIRVSFLPHPMFLDFVCLATEAEILSLMHRGLVSFLTLAAEEYVIWQMLN